MELPFDPAIPLLGLYPKNPETPIQKNLCTPMFIAAQFTIAKYWKQPKCPSANEWIPKLWYIYTMEFYTAERKKELIPFAMAWMELENIFLFFNHLIFQTIHFQKRLQRIPYSFHSDFPNINIFTILINVNSHSKLSKSGNCN